MYPGLSSWNGEQPGEPMLEAEGTEKAFYIARPPIPAFTELRLKAAVLESRPCHSQKSNNMHGQVGTPEPT